MFLQVLERRDCEEEQLSQLHIPLSGVHGVHCLCISRCILIPVNDLGWEKELKGKENSKRKLAENRGVGKQLIWPLVNPLPWCLKVVAEALTLNSLSVG